MRMYIYIHEQVKAVRSVVFSESLWTVLQPCCSSSIPLAPGGVCKVWPAEERRPVLTIKGLKRTPNTHAKCNKDYEWPSKSKIFTILFFYRRSLLAPAPLQWSPVPNNPLYHWLRYSTVMSTQGSTHHKVPQAQHQLRFHLSCLLEVALVSPQHRIK